MSKITIGGLKVDSKLAELVTNMCGAVGQSPEKFWDSLGNIVTSMEPVNATLLKKRDQLQAQLDAYWIVRRGLPVDMAAQTRFLSDIGYLVPEGPQFTISTSNVDAEIAKVAGPQLVVPVDNARFAINAANSRWGSLYDALYGTNVISTEGNLTNKGKYNTVRGQKVIEFANRLLDETVPLDGGSYANATELTVENGKLVARLGSQQVGLRAPQQLVAFAKGGKGQITSIVLKHNNLHLELQIDRQHPIGKAHKAGVKDVIMEAALTAICDFEDSVSAVDAADKCTVYANWYGLMNGTLSATFPKGDQKVERSLNPDRRFDGVDGKPYVLSGRSLLLVRNVGIHMYTDAVTTANDRQIPEGFLDCMMAALGALSDKKRMNSKHGSVYIVKPKMHGPAEVAFVVQLFGRVEEALGMPKNTLKIGIMDEERRTSANLYECVRMASERVVFINTGFLDRTGDEIHSCFELGPVFPKGQIKAQPWIGSYEDSNVAVGLASGFSGKAQIGKGMWAEPDAMAEMLKAKIAHPKAAANTAWVPSPTAATLHALHYHQVYVQAEQEKLLKSTLVSPERRNQLLTGMLLPPVVPPAEEERLRSNEKLIEDEVNANCQGILGYVVRWVEMGIGCSKVPDVRNVGLMEDRATLRISSQHLANWLHHGICSTQQVISSMKRMAEYVDKQNAHESAYKPMAPDFEKSVAFQCAMDLVFGGKRAPNGLTESALTTRRRQAKRGNNAKL